MDLFIWSTGKCSCHWHRHILQITNMSNPNWLLLHFFVKYFICIVHTPHSAWHLFYKLTYHNYHSAISDRVISTQNQKLTSRVIAFLPSVVDVRRNANAPLLHNILVLTFATRNDKCKINIIRSYMRLETLTHHKTHINNNQCIVTHTNWWPAIELLHRSDGASFVWN